MKIKEVIARLEDIKASIANHANDKEYDLERDRDNARKEALQICINLLYCNFLVENFNDQCRSLTAEEQNAIEELEKKKFPRKPLNF